MTKESFLINDISRGNGGGKGCRYLWLWGNDPFGCGVSFLGLEVIIIGYTNVKKMQKYEVKRIAN